MRRVAFFLVAGIALGCFSSHESHAARRVALVIGNSAYEHTQPLANPVNDAADVTVALKRLGFEVIAEHDLKKVGMDNAFRRFARALDAADAALFFYAGHGMQLQGVNYLMPVDAKLEHEADLPYEMAQLDAVLADMGRVQGVRIAILDACRDNPLEKQLKSRLARTRNISQTRGLARVTRTEGQLIAFATQAGTVADDGAGRNSPFTAALLKHLENTDLEAGLLFRRVAADVHAATGGKQLPELSVSLLGEFYFAGRDGGSIRSEPAANADDGKLAALQREVEALKRRLQQPEPKKAPQHDEPKVAVGAFATPPAAFRPNPFGHEPETLRPAISPPPRSRGPGRTLRGVQARGKLKCGVNTGLRGFSMYDSGRWSGLDVDYCRAVAAAIFDDPDRVQYVPLTARDRFTALQTGEIDLLVRNSTRTDDRENKLGLDFVGPNFYDGTAFIVRRALGIGSVLELSGATVCVQTGTTTELEVAKFFQAHGMKFMRRAVSQFDELAKAYLAGRCDTFATDASALAVQRTDFPSPREHLILPELISKSALGPWVRERDDQWLTLARWILLAMVRAEELGVTSSNVTAMRANGDAAVKTLLGEQGDLGSRLAVRQNWAFNVVRHVGNYAEVYARNLGGGSAFELARGLNELQPTGGLMSSAPMD